MKKVYIGDKVIEDKEFQSINSIDMLDFVAEDAECTAIVLDGRLRNTSHQLWMDTIGKSIKKLRIGGVLKIIDIDVDILLYFYSLSRDVGDLQNIFVKPISSLINIETLKHIMQNFPHMSELGSATRGVEFDIEYARAS